MGSNQGTSIDLSSIRLTRLLAIASTALGFSAGGAVACCSACVLLGLRETGTLVDGSLPADETSRVTFSVSTPPEPAGSGRETSTVVLVVRALSGSASLRWTISEAASTSSITKITSLKPSLIGT